MLLWTVAGHDGRNPRVVRSAGVEHRDAPQLPQHRRVVLRVGCAGHIPTNPAAQLPVMRVAAPAPRPAPDAVWFAAITGADPRDTEPARGASSAR
jgi:hypothetical protein